MNKVNHYIENLLAQYSSRNVNAFIDTAAEDMSSIYLSKVELEGESEEVSGFDDDTVEGDDEEVYLPLPPLWRKKAGWWF